MLGKLAALEIDTAALRRGQEDRNSQIKALEAERDAVRRSCNAEVSLELDSLGWWDGEGVESSMWEGSRSKECTVFQCYIFRVQDEQFPRSQNFTISCC